MEGFVLELVPDDEDLPTVYWTANGAGLEDLNQANLYADLASARIEAGRIQAAYTGYSVQAIAAAKGIILKKNVAASTPNPTIAPVT